MNRVRQEATTGTVQIPAELLRSIPRDCELTIAGKVVAGVTIAMVLGALAFSIGAYISATRTSALRREMAEHGQVVTGVVVQTYRTGGDDKQDVFLYEFSVDGKTYEGRTEIGTRVSPRYPAEGSVPVRYMPANPKINWIDGYPPSAVPLFLIPLLGFGMLAAAFAIHLSLRRQRELVAEGRPALARVLKVERVRRGEHNKRRAYIEFASSSGARQEAHIDFGRNAPQPDSNMVIVYDGEDPRRVLRYPAPLVRAGKPEAW